MLVTIIITRKSYWCCYDHKYCPQFALLLTKKKRCLFRKFCKGKMLVNSHTFRNQFEAISTKVNNILYSATVSMV